MPCAARMHIDRAYHSTTPHRLSRSDPIKSDHENREPRLFEVTCIAECCYHWVRAWLFGECSNVNLCQAELRAELPGGCKALERQI